MYQLGNVVRSAPLRVSTLPGAGCVRGIYFLPLSTMLYRARLQFCINIEASGKSEAHSKAVAMLKQNPESYITKIEEAQITKKVSALQALIWGK